MSSKFLYVCATSGLIGLLVLVLAARHPVNQLVSVQALAAPTATESQTATVLEASSIAFTLADTLAPPASTDPPALASPTETVPPTAVPTTTNTVAPTVGRTQRLKALPTASPWPPTATPVPPAPTDPAAQRVLDLTNAERARAGLQALRWNANLASAANWFAQDMAANDVQTLSHTDRLGRDAPTRLLAFGYRWVYYGENLAMGYASAESVVAGWMGSPGHRENILSPNMRELGVGHASNGTDFWAQDFGSR